MPSEFVNLLQILGRFSDEPERSTKIMHIPYVDLYAANSDNKGHGSTLD